MTAPHVHAPTPDGSPCDDVVRDVLLDQLGGCCDLTAQQAARTVAALGAVDGSDSAQLVPLMVLQTFAASTAMPRRVAMAHALATLPVATSVLVKHLRSGDVDAQLLVLLALRAPQHRGAAAAVADVVRSGDTALACAALTTLASFGDVDVIGAITPWLMTQHALHIAACAALTSCAKQPFALSALATFAASDDVQLQQAALCALLTVGGAVACACATTALNSKSPTTRRIAVCVVHRHGDERHAHQLRTCTNDPDAGVRRAATEAMRQLSA